MTPFDAPPRWASDEQMVPSRADAHAVIERPRGIVDLRQRLNRSLAARIGAGMQ